MTPFHLFGTSHLVAMALTVALPLAGALLARHEHLGRHADRITRIALALFQAGGWAGWLVYSAAHHSLTLDNGLPLNLCDWAEAALIVALLTRNQFAYELGYFWGLCGTLQGVLTPTIYWDYPHPEFFFFFIQHGGVVASLLYLTLGTRMRPVPRSLPRVIAASIGYAVFAGLMDWALGVNYGFLRAKPLGTNMLTFMSPWPWYIPELVGAGVLFVLFYYTPFALIDWWRRPEKG